MEKFLGHLLGLLYSAEVFCRSPAPGSRRFSTKAPKCKCRALWSARWRFRLCVPRSFLPRGLPPWTARWRPSRRELTSVTDGGRIAWQRKLGVPNNWDPGSSACVVCGCAGFPSLTSASHSAFYHAFHPRPFPAPYVGQR